MDRPVATCRKCNTTCEYRKFLTFCHWWCPKCKDEPENVALATTGCPRAEKYGYHQESGDYLLNDAGIWKLVYTDGSVEFYERRPGASKSVLDGSRLRSATRLTDSDLPGRKPVQSLAEASAGGQAQGQGVRPVSTQANSGKGCVPKDIATYLDYDVKAGLIGAWDFDPSTNRYTIHYPWSGKFIFEAEDVEQAARDSKANKPTSQARQPGSTNCSIPPRENMQDSHQELPENRRGDSSDLLVDIEYSLRDVEGSDKSVQFREMPPDDEL